MWKLFSFLKMFREDLLVMMAAVKDSRTPVAIKAAFLVGLLYCISPIDVIPDTVPVLGMVAGGGLRADPLLAAARACGCTGEGRAARAAAALYRGTRLARAHCMDRSDRLGRRSDLSLIYGFGQLMDDGLLFHFGGRSFSLGREQYS